MARTSTKKIDLSKMGRNGEIIVFACHGFSARDLTDASNLVERQGFKVSVISGEKSIVLGLSEANEEMNFIVDGQPETIDSRDYLGLVIPDGVPCDDLDSATLKFLDAFLKSGRPVCALGSGVALLSKLADRQIGKPAALLALKGDVFAASGEHARLDALSTFANLVEREAQSAKTPQTA